MYVPRPGNWYALFYIKWEDPRTRKVEQQGLVAACRSILYTDLQVRRQDNIKLINCYIPVTVDYSKFPLDLKCMSKESIEPITLNIIVVNVSLIYTKVAFSVGALSLPSDDSYILNCAFDPKINNVQTISFSPHPSAWHYFRIELVIGNASKYVDCKSYMLRSDDDDVENQTVIDLMRDNIGRLFIFDYGLPTTNLQNATSQVNITSNVIKTVRFKVNQHLDVGGTLCIEARLLLSFKYYMGYKRELKEGSLLVFTEDDQFFKVVICIDIDHRSIPLENGRCKYNDIEKPALFVLNSIDSETIADRVIIPFPDSGTWYLTLRLFCDKVVCPCRTSDNGRTYYVKSNTLESEKEADSDLSWNQIREGSSECNATVILSVSSNACVNGKCSNQGNCSIRAVNGMVVSFCICSGGYGGWDCSDDSRMDKYMLVSVLILTLSNLLFIFSMYVAIIRLYYTEAVMYAFTMVFSILYHACDAPMPVAYCIIKIKILKFADFYCGIMSFWVTLLAMTILSERFKSSLQLTGAIVIAVLTTWNRRSCISFFLPVAVGIIFVLTSWYMDYRKYRKMLYPRSYYTQYLPLGIVLVSVGLFCYAFLQTEQNYKIVHSFWHMTIAVSVVFLLPDVKRGSNSSPFVPTKNCYRLNLCRILRRPLAAARAAD